MNKANLYNKYHSLQKTDAIFAIENYLRLIKWRNDGEENILDIGSGDGDVILNLLLPKFPQHFNQLICTDASEEMVEFAKKRCFHRKIAFEKLNIEMDDIPHTLHSRFDHVFSFYCFHWIQDLEKAMRNVYRMMRPGADLLFIFLQNCPVFDIYESMARKPQWAPHMKDIKRYIPAFHYSTDPEREMEEILKKIGFVSRLCRVEDRSYTYPSWPVVIQSVVAVNPFLSRIPKGSSDDYISDYVQEVKNNANIKINRSNNNDDEQVHFPYKLFIIYASKPM